MSVGHTQQCANWHVIRQVPIDTLPVNLIGPLKQGMSNDFQTAFKWHLEKHGTKIVTLVEETGVSRDVVNKLKGRAVASTAVENAVLIAAFYGKTVNQFLLCEDVPQEDQVKNLFELMTPQERQMLRAQILGLLRSRAD